MSLLFWESTVVQPLSLTHLTKSSSMLAVLAECDGVE
jgi:hypothetical protein